MYFPVQDIQLQIYFYQRIRKLKKKLNKTLKDPSDYMQKMAGVMKGKFDKY